MKPRGEVTAEKMYGCKGWLAHHNTDLWGDTAPQDIEFLKEKYHLMKGAGECFSQPLLKWAS